MNQIVKKVPSKVSIFSLSIGVLLFLLFVSYFCYLINKFQPTEEFPYSNALLMTGFFFCLLFVSFIYVPYMELKKNPVFQLKGSSKRWSKRKAENMIQSLSFEEGPLIYDAKIIEWNDVQFSLFVAMEIDHSSLIEISKQLVFDEINTFIQEKTECMVTDIEFEITCFDHEKKGK